MEEKRLYQLKHAGDHSLGKGRSLNSDHAAVYL